MKYVKNYKNYFSINESINIKDSSSLMNALMVNIFSVFKSHLPIEKMFNDSNLNDIPLDIYDFFTDVKSLLQLGELGIQEFADNMGLGDDENIVSSVLNKTYNDKFKRDLMLDLDSCILYLKDNNINEQYLNNLQEFKDLLKK